MADKKYKLIPNPKYGFFDIKPTPSPEEITKYYAQEFYSSDFKRFNNSALKVFVSTDAIAII